MESEPNRSKRPRLAGSTFLVVAMGIAIVMLVVAVGVLVVLLALEENPFLRRTQAAILAEEATATVGSVVGLLPESTYTPLPTFTPLPTETPLPSQTPETTHTPLPTHTPYPTFTPRGPTATRYITPVFMFNAKEVLYLDSSIRQRNFWNPATPTPFVSENDRIAILQLVRDKQAYREYVWRYQEYGDLDRYNAGYGLTQMQRYYEYYIDPSDGCYANVWIVDDQFHTDIIYYDGSLARTMTSKVESREHICDGVRERLIANDAYAYELMLQKFTNGGGTVYWRIIEHPLGSDPSQH
jgi:hypothetical protein